MQFRTLYGRWESLFEATFDRVFDRWHRLDFDGIIPTDHLLSEHRAALTQATGYEATSGLQLRVLVSEALRINPDFATFVDLGAGKGKACIYVAREFDIGRIVGVDLEAFLANNRDHFRSFRSVIAYENDRHRASLAKFGFETMHREQTSKRSLYVLPPAQG